MSVWMEFRVTALGLNADRVGLMLKSFWALSHLRDLEDEEGPVEDREKEWPHEGKVTKLMRQFIQQIFIKS